MRKLAVKQCGRMIIMAIARGRQSNNYCTMICDRGQNEGSMDKADFGRRTTVKLFSQSGQSFTSKKCMEINGTRSTVKTNLWQKSTIKVENPSWPTLAPVTDYSTGVTPPWIVISLLSLLPSWFTIVIYCTINTIVNTFYNSLVALI